MALLKFKVYNFYFRSIDTCNEILESQSHRDLKSTLRRFCCSLSSFTLQALEENVMEEEKTLQTEVEEEKEVVNEKSGW